MKLCHNCKREISMDFVGVRDECPFCKADLHVCLNCSLYEGGRCMETRAEPVRDRERMNFCEYFKFREEKASSREDAERLLREIFKKS